MIPYATFLYFGTLLYVAVPTLLIEGFSWRPLRQFWIVFASGLMLIVQYQDPALRLVFGYGLLQWLAMWGFLRLRRRHKNRVVFYSALAVALMPLILTRILPLLQPGNVIGFLGISYITFRVIDLVMGIQDGLIVQLSPIDFGAYLFFFPTVSSGPIDRYRRFLRDWTHERTRGEFMNDLDSAVRHLFRGFLYKFVLAVLIQRYWLDPAGHGSGPGSLISYMYAYSFYLFFDFAGYSAFAVAISELLGIHTPENFNRPFAARNIREFWDRWHISLSWWFRDHVYSRFVYAAVKGKWFKSKRTTSYLAFYLSMGLMGLWHGLTWYYILYGLYHGTLLVGYDLFITWRTRQLTPNPQWARLSTFGAIFVTFNLVCFGFLLFSGRLDGHFIH